MSIVLFYYFEDLWCYVVYCCIVYGGGEGCFVCGFYFGVGFEYIS